MIPRSFTLTGSLGIKAGLNRDAVTMDFSGIPDDAVTIAIKGDNGMGKSTILNLGLTPYRMPPHVDDIYSHFGPVGERELLFSHGGVMFKSDITIKQTEKTKSMTSILRVKNNDKWEPVITDDKTISDGKNGTYDKCLDFIMGPKSIYYMSAFKSQGAKPLASHDDPKSLMRDLLSLDAPDKLAIKSNLVAKALRAEVDGMRDEAIKIEMHESDLVAVKGDLILASEEVARLSESIPGMTDAALDAKLAYEEARTNSANNVELEKQYKAVNEKLFQAESDLAATLERHKTLTNTCGDAIAKSRGFIASYEPIVSLAELSLPKAIKVGDDIRAGIEIAQEKLVGFAATEAKLGACSNQIFQFSNRKNLISKDLAMESMVDAAELRIPAINAEIKDIQESIKKTREDIESYNKKRSEKHGFETELSGISKAGVALKEKHDDLVNRSGFIETVPCKANGEFAHCPALKNAVDAKQSIPKSEIELVDLREKWNSADRNVTNLTIEINNFGDLNVDRDRCEMRMKSLTEELTKLTTVTAMRDKITMAKEEIITIDKNLAELNKERDQLLLDDQSEIIRNEIKLAKNELIENTVKTNRHSTDASKRHAINSAGVDIQRNQDLLASENNDIQEITEGYELRIESAKLELDGLPPLDNDLKLEHTLNAMTRENNALAMVEQQHHKCIADAAALESKISTLEDELKNSPQIKARISKLSDELAMWKLLTISMRGVIDLSIEDAGPAIAEIANQLLLDAYGPRFTIKILSQVMQGNGILKETFDIMVIDAQSGLESSILKKSGGEMVWLDKAITDAVAIFHKNAAGIDYECGFADEAEDGLTEERKAQMYKMDRAALRIGNYQRKFFISHSPSAWTYADHVIDLKDFKINERKANS